MKKILIIGSSSLLAVVLLLLGTGIYINANIKDITQNFLGAGIEFESVRFRYSPMPTIVMSDLTIDHENNTIQIPSLELYPDLMAMLKGNFFLREVVLQKPIIQTEYVAVAPPDKNVPARPALTMAAIPAQWVGNIAINQGRVILTENNIPGQPMSFTMAMEDIHKDDEILSVKVKDFTVEELGIKFTGDISVSNFSSLNLMIQAPTASLNLGATKDFLMRFGFLSSDVGSQIPVITNLAARDLALEINHDSGKFILSSGDLNFDRTELKELELNLGLAGQYDLKCGRILLDMNTIQEWMMENPKGKELMDNFLAGAKLKTLNAEGSVALSSIVLSGTQADEVDMNGSMDLKADGLKVHLVSETGEEQTFTISELDTHVIIDKGKPSLKVSNLRFSSSQGGMGFAQMAMSLPFHPRQWEFKTDLNSVHLFDYSINGNASKTPDGPFTFDMALSAPAMAVQAKGHIKKPQYEKFDFEARLTDLIIAINKDEQGKDAGIKKPARENTDFDFSKISAKKFAGIAQVRAFQYGDLPEVKDVNLEVACQNNRAVIKGSVRLSDLDIQVNLILMHPNELVTQIEGRGANLDLTSFIASYSKELPVFLTGRITVLTSLFTMGKNTDALLSSAKGEIMVNLNQISVHKLSNLDSRLGFFLDMLASAGIGKQKGDTIFFDKGIVKADLQDGCVVLNRFSLDGPIMSTWGKGEFHLKEKRLLLNGQVQTALGITKDVTIDRILVKRET